MLQRIGGAMMYSVSHRVGPSRISRREEWDSLTDRRTAAATDAIHAAYAASVSATGAAGPSATATATATTTATATATVVAAAPTFTHPFCKLRAVITLPPTLLRKLTDAFATNPSHWHSLRVEISQHVQPAHRPPPAAKPWDESEAEGDEAGDGAAQDPPCFRLAVGFVANRGFETYGDSVARAQLTFGALRHATAAAADGPIDRQAKLPSIWLNPEMEMPSHPRPPTQHHHTRLVAQTYLAVDPMSRQQHMMDGGLFAVFSRLGSQVNSLVDVRRGARLDVYEGRVVLLANATMGGVVRAEAFEDDLYH